MLLEWLWDVSLGNGDRLASVMFVSVELAIGIFSRMRRGLVKKAWSRLKNFTFQRCSFYLCFLQTYAALCKNSNIECILTSLPVCSFNKIAGDVNIQPPKRYKY